MVLFKTNLNCPFRTQGPQAMSPTYLLPLTDGRVPALCTKTKLLDLSESAIISCLLNLSPSLNTIQLSLMFCASIAQP